MSDLMEQTYYQKNKDKILLQKKLFYQENQTRLQEERRTKYILNREKELQRYKIYRDSLSTEVKRERSKLYLETNSEKVKARRSTPYARYLQQKHAANARDIPWEFTFDSWWKLWEESGHWEERGIAYCMCRTKDIGPYSPTNTRIDTVSNNTLESKLVKGELLSLT